METYVQSDWGRDNVFELVFEIEAVCLNQINVEAVCLV